MGICAGLFRIAPSELEAVRVDPERLDDIVIDEGDTPEKENARLDLDKSWDALLALLTGDCGVQREAHPLAAAILGDEPVVADYDPIGVEGAPPPRWLSPERVRALSASVARLDPETLRSRLPLDPAADVYFVEAWASVDGTEALREIFAELREFLAKAAGRGEAVVSYFY